MNNNILIVVLVAAALYMLMGSTGNATGTTTQPSAGCLQSIQAQYSAQWAEMSTVQRALVGLRAASCEGGR